MAFKSSERRRRFLVQSGASLLLLIVLALHAGGVWRLNPIDRLDALRHDLWTRHLASAHVEDRVVIIDIDEKSLAEVGRWPWPRERMAALSDKLLRDYGVAALAFDIVFAEPDTSSGLPVLEGLARGELAQTPGFSRLLGDLRPRLDYDGRLAAALAGGPVVLGYYFNFGAQPEITGQLPAPLLDCAELAAVGVQPLRATGYNANLPALQAAAGQAAFFNSWPDFDGVNRRMPVVLEHDGKCYGALSLLTAKVGMFAEAAQVLPAAGLRPPALDLDGLVVPLDADATALVPYARVGAFRYVAASDVMAGRAPADLLEGRIVLIGSTAPGIMDLRVTPVAKAFPGVEIHANLIAGILDASIPWAPARPAVAGVVLVLLAGLPLALLLPILTPLRAGLLSAVAIALLIGLDFYAWGVLRASLPLAAALLAVAGLFVLNMSYGFFIEARSKAQITRLFGQYVPPELVDEMAKDPARYGLRGESRELTVLFSDIRDFTSISERLEAAELADMLNAYLSAMTDLIQQRNGTIDKYIGDAIMAFWGAPMSDDRHARDAVLTALAMQAVLAELNPRLAAQGWPPVRIGVGVNSGRMSVGNMGSRFRMAYTVMGDAVNLASRLEGLTKQYGVGVLVGAATRTACPDIVFMAIDTVRVKGKQEPVAIFTPLGVAGEVEPERIRAAAGFEAALAAYRARDWAAARAALLALRGTGLDTELNTGLGKLIDLYLDRIGHFENNPPPPDWDGAFTFSTK